VSSLHSESLIEDARFTLQGLRSASIRERSVATSINNTPVGHFQVLELFENVQGTESYPQTIADIVSNSYFRLTYQKPNGTSATFGSSIVGAVSFRTSDHKLHFIPSVTGVAVFVDGPERLSISISALHGNAARLRMRRIYATNAELYQTTMNAEVSFTALRDIYLDKSQLGNDCFRFFTISSMYANPDRYDANVITLRSGSEFISTRLESIETRGRYIFPNAQASSEIGLIKTFGSTGAVHTPGSPDSPSIEARVLDSSVPAEELGLQAYLSDSKSINADSLSLWLEWIACPAIIKKGQSISTKIQYSAIPPQAYEK